MKQSGPVRVTNLENFRVEISVAGSRFPLESLHTARNVESGPTLEIVVRELPARRVVPIKVWQLGTGGTARSQSAALNVEVPIDGAEARKRIDEALRAAEIEGERRIVAGKGNPMVHDRLRRKHDLTVKALQEQYFHENRTGSFDVQAFYRSSTPGYWNGISASDPVPFEIVYEGDYLQKHGMR